MGEIFTDARVYRFVFGGKCQIIQKLIEDGKIKYKNFDCPVAAESCLGLMEYFLRTYVIGDPPEDPGGLARSKH